MDSMGKVNIWQIHELIEISDIHVKLKGSRVLRGMTYDSPIPCIICRNNLRSESLCRNQHTHFSAITILVGGFNSFGLTISPPDGHHKWPWTRSAAMPGFLEKLVEDCT